MGGCHGGLCHGGERRRGILPWRFAFATTCLNYSTGYEVSTCDVRRVEGKTAAGGGGRKTGVTIGNPAKASLRQKRAANKTGGVEG
jgi:hypothetical protein